MSAIKGGLTAVTVRKLRVSHEEDPASADEVIAEEPLEIRLRGTALAVLMRTPGLDEALACGFALTEGIVPPERARAIKFASHCRTTPLEARGNVINLHVSEDLEVDLEGLQRNTYASSSCGICGKASLDAVTVRSLPLPAPDPNLRVTADLITRSVKAMRARQSLFARTGGVHAAALVDLRSGAIRAIAEDVGRHNAVDKVVGHAVLKRMIPLSRYGLVVSGRVSFEIVQKALVAGIPVLAGVSAPSSLAVRLADRSGMTLVGFVRGPSMNVYCEGYRVHSTTEQE